MIASLSGAMELPSPVISEVIPWKIFEGRRGSTRIVSSDWPSMSMKPGATTLPPASMVRLRGAAVRFPMAAIFPSRIPRSPEYQGEPVPSMMWPWVMTRSKDGVWARATWRTAEMRTKIENSNCGRRCDLDVLVHLSYPQGLKPETYFMFYAALKGRSSTLTHALRPSRAAPPRCGTVAAAMPPMAIHAPRASHS